MDVAPISADRVPIGRRIDRQYAALSPQEQRAADVVLDRLEDLAVYSASEIADLSGVSKATVSRLVRRLGYEDFAQLRTEAKLLRGLGSPIGSSGPAESAGGDPLAAHLEAERLNLERMALAAADGRIAAAGNSSRRRRRSLSSAAATATRSPCTCASSSPRSAAASRRCPYRARASARTWWISARGTRPW